MSCQLPIAATLLLRSVSGALVEDRQQPTPKAYGPVRAISIKNPESRSPALGLFEAELEQFLAGEMLRSLPC
ncbi:hypothetical protein QUB56_16375 [Microcoleus sp. AR_TQ3_B6]|uniref:hypothetical protein n=1 Tax=Microcoleus sp. AR_TQ3_B6 TaxID=3055284 RepID=UPI002FD4EECE